MVAETLLDQVGKPILVEMERCESTSSLHLRNFLIMKLMIWKSHQFVHQILLELIKIRGPNKM